MYAFGLFHQKAPHLKIAGLFGFTHFHSTKEVSIILLAEKNVIYF